MSRKITCFVFILSFILTSCSVYMAAKHEGASLEEIQQCKTRSCLIAKGAVPISSEKNEKDELIEVYKVRAKKGSTARAVMHGLLDVSTLGVWEVAGTPIEGAKGKKKFFAIKVYYDKNENIKKIELVQ